MILAGLGLLGLLATLSCGPQATSVPADPAPVSAPAPAPPSPVAASRVGRTLRPSPRTPAVEAARARLRQVVWDHARDPANPWAVAHAMLALGAEFPLADLQDPVDALFAQYARRGPDGGLVFPAEQGAARVEPHTDLLLKALAEAGVPADRPVVVEGQPAQVADLWRASLRAAWVEGERVSYGPWNDAPWALQGLAHYAEPGAAWVADGGRPMTMDAFTLSALDRLDAESAFLREGIAQGVDVPKRGQHLFSYTCGGAHLFQGVASAVARGHGGDGARPRVAAHAPVWLFRLDSELRQIDAALQARPDLGPILVVQRLKFLGHLLESLHKLSATGLWAPGEAEAARLDYALAQLVATVELIERVGIFGKLPELRAANEQLYLDYVGDSAHALRGLELAIGEGVVRY